MTFCTPIANAQGSHTFKIICTVYHRSSMPCRVIGTQNVNITSREEDRDQGQTPSQTVTLAIFKYFQGWVLTHPFHFSFCIFSTSFFPPSSIIPHVLGTLTHIQGVLHLGSHPKMRTKPDLKLQHLPVQFMSCYVTD